MATLKHSETQQIVEGVDAETFLRDICDPSFWEVVVADVKAIEEKVLDFIEPVIEKVENLFAPQEIIPGVVDVEPEAIESPDNTADQAAVEVQQ